jgi:hypothetical protein
MFDAILNKVFRSIDANELEDGGTRLDVVNRVEKRGIVASSERVRDLKDLRNDIVHEYVTDCQTPSDKRWTHARSFRNRRGYRTLLQTFRRRPGGSDLSARHTKCCVRLQ